MSLQPERACCYFQHNHVKCADQRCGSYFDHCCSHSPLNAMPSLTNDHLDDNDCHKVINYGGEQLSEFGNHGIVPPTSLAAPQSH